MGGKRFNLLPLVLVMVLESGIRYMEVTLNLIVAILADASLQKESVMAKVGKLPRCRSYISHEDQSTKELPQFTRSNRLPLLLYNLAPTHCCRLPGSGCCSALCKSICIGCICNLLQNTVVPKKQEVCIRSVHCTLWDTYVGTI